MFPLKISALFLCALASGILFLDGIPIDEDHQENAFDKIIKADRPYGKTNSNISLRDFSLGSSCLPFFQLFVFPKIFSTFNKSFSS